MASTIADVSFSETIHSIIDILGSNQGTITLGIASAVALGTPVADRLLIRRKRIQYQVLYNSKIGLSPVLMDEDPDEPTPPTTPNPELTHVAKLLDRLSVVIIRIRNTGSYDIGESDFEPPLSFTFGRRVVWNARISEASDPQLRTHIRQNLEFFTNSDTPAAREEQQPAGAPVETSRNLSSLRRLLPVRMSAFFTPAPTAPVATVRRAPQWHGVRLAKLWMRRGQSFILVVVLREADENSTTISKEYRVTGGHSTGKTIIDEKRQRRFGWPLILTAIGVMLVGALLATLIIGPSQRPGNPTVPCAPGTVRIEGSSAFGPMVESLADTYMALCPDVRFQFTFGGTNAGLQDLTSEKASDAADLMVLSDGLAPPKESAGLPQQLVAVLVYGIVVNRDVVLNHNLTTKELQGIYAGTYTNWSDLGGPADLPIRLVGRGSESGTRQTLERYLLNKSEGVLSSNDCLTRDRGPFAPTTLCERDTTEQLVGAVAATPGAIGYADVANTTTKQAVRADKIVPIDLDGHAPDIDSLPAYQFWTVEHLYTKGTPPPGTAIEAFLEYLARDPAQTAMASAGYTPCVLKDGVRTQWCGQR